MVFPCHNNSDINTLNLKSREEQGHAVFFKVSKSVNIFVCIVF